MRTIKRYSNRKLYDTREKRYLTLNHLGTLVGRGEKIQVVDNDSGKDITGVILSKALMDKEKESGGGFLPTELFSNLLQGKPHELLEYLRASWESGLDQIKEFESEIDRRFKGFLKSGKLTTKDALKLRDSLLQGLRERWRVLETALESRIESAIEAIPVASRRDVERIEKQIEDLAELVERISDAEEGSGHKPAARKKTASKRKASGKKAAPKKAATRKPAATKARTRRPAPKKKAPARRKPATRKR